MASIVRRIVLLGLMLSLAGCFRQAEETFEAVSPEASTADGSAFSTLPPFNSSVVPTSTIPVLVTVAPTNTLDSVATQPIIVVITPTETPGQTFITPGSPLSTLIVVSATPTLGTPGSPTPGGLITPTDFFNPDETGTNSACEYEVKGGDTLFRIAVNNDTTVDAIKTANDMTGDAIFPGDILIIPGCGDATVEATSEPGVGPTALPDGWQVHTVSTGEVLGAIAERYGVRQSAIIEANNLSNPNALSVGQELIIPAPE